MPMLERRVLEKSSEPSMPSHPVLRLGKSAMGRVAEISKTALNFLLPPRCAVSDEPLARDGVLGAKGWAKIRFIDSPFCERCGVPFGIDVAASPLLCGQCVADQFGFDRARAAICYEGEGRRLTLAYKHHDRTELTPLFAGWLARAGGCLVEPQSVLVPVPLHWRRLASRRFNQAALLAKATAPLLGVSYDLDLLIRKRATPPQQQLSLEARARNVRGAFALPPERELAVNAHIILIDDVFTTGATLSACAQVLKRAGVSKVDALVLARVV